MPAPALPPTGHPVHRASSWAGGTASLLRVPVWVSVVTVTAAAWALTMATKRAAAGLLWSGVQPG